jgi:poly-gamma-glutamate synthesis protein (capsule biosynthesis protein)
MKKESKKRYFNLPLVLIIIITLFVALFLPLTSCQAGENFIKDSSRFNIDSFLKWIGFNNNETSGAETTGEAGETGKEHNGQNGGVEEAPIISAEDKTVIKIWIDDVIPQDIRTKILKQANQVCNVVEETTKNEAQIKIELMTLPDSEDGAQGKDKSDSKADIYWVLAPVISFFTVCDEILWDDFLNFWSGDSESLNYLVDGETEINLILTTEVYNALKKMFGEPSVSQIKIVDKNEVDRLLWENKGYFSIIPFEDISKKYKVLDLNGNSIFDKELDIHDYPLTCKIIITVNNKEGYKNSGEEEKVVSELKNNIKSTIATNRDTGKLTTINMTGVTAMARQIRRRIDAYGVLSPGEKIVETLKNADITHISNEIPFVEGCTGAREEYIVFCSSPEYIELLRYVGTDVIELTGNHMNDYGNEWMYYTLDMYDKEGWPYFGGGRNIEECYRPATFEINGNKIAFLGANTFGPESNWATENTPGSARINMWDEVQKEEDMKKFEEIIKSLKSQGYNVIFTFQYEETYSFSPTEYQKADFRRIIDAGADIVSGSQSHHPMGIEFRGNGFINYGLGNLFFGQQLQILGNNPGIITKHIFYDGKHINTVLITTMLNDFSQPRLTTEEEREKLLKSIFEGSIIEAQD